MSLSLEGFSHSVKSSQFWDVLNVSFGSVAGFHCDSRITLARDFGEGHLVVTLPRWGGFSEIVPKLAAAGTRFVEISGNDEIVITTDDNKVMPDKVHLLFESMVISPTNTKRSVYIVRIEDLHVVLNSMNGKDIELEHIFDF